MTHNLITDSGLPPKIQRFCEEWMIDNNGTQAAKRAGYSEHSAESQASALLRKHKVQEYISKLKTKQTKRLELSSDKVLSNIAEIADRCMQEVKPLVDRKGRPIIVADKDGNPAEAFVFDANAALRGNELLGKHLNLFKDDNEGGSKTTNQTLIINVTDEQLERVIRKIENEC